ncbi:MAG: amino acid permease [Dehalococcoidia bacterium]|nr:amino acid permease [Dehalococcoidia bacterium]
MDTGYDLRFYVGRSVSANLRREIGMVGLIAIMVGLNIGGSLFLLTGIAAGLTGSSLLLAQLVSAAPILLALPAYSALSAALPVTCANYQYAKLFSRPLAVAAWMVLFIAIPLGMLPLFAVAIAKLIAVLLPGLNVTLWAVVVMSLLFLVNVLGVRLATQTQFIGVIVLVAALLTFILGGMPSVSVENLRPAFSGGVVGFVGAAALLYTLLAGGLFGIEMGDEVRNARNVIPRALVISIGIVLSLYLLIEAVAIGTVGWSQFSAGTLGDVAETFLPAGWLGFFVVGGGIVASATTINLALAAAGRYALAFSFDGYFPRVFSRVNRRFGTPHNGLLLVYLMTVCTLLVNPPLMTLGSVLNFGLLFMVTLVLFAAVRLLRRHPATYVRASVQVKPRRLVVCSSIAIAINCVYMLVLAVAMRWTFFIFVAAILIGLALFYARKLGLFR